MQNKIPKYATKEIHTLNNLVVDTGDKLLDSKILIVLGYLIHEVDRYITRRQFNRKIDDFILLPHKTLTKLCGRRDTKTKVLNYLLQYKIIEWYKSPDSKSKTGASWCHSSKNVKDNYARKCRLARQYYDAVRSFQTTILNVKVTNDEEFLTWKMFDMHNYRKNSEENIEIAVELPIDQGPKEDITIILNQFKPMKTTLPPLNPNDEKRYIDQIDFEDIFLSKEEPKVVQAVYTPIIVKEKLTTEPVAVEETPEMLIQSIKPAFDWNIIQKAVLTPYMTKTEQESQTYVKKDIHNQSIVKSEQEVIQYIDQKVSQLKIEINKKNPNKPLYEAVKGCYDKAKWLIEKNK